MRDWFREDMLATAEEIIAQSERLGNRKATGYAGPLPGDVYVFGQKSDIQWMVIRYHPDDPNLILLAPVDGFPLAGTPDLTLQVKRVGGPLTVRCGQTEWIHRDVVKQANLIDYIPEKFRVTVQRRLADLARGRDIEPQAIDFDHQYENWLLKVASARCQLYAKSLELEKQQQRS